MFLHLGNNVLVNSKDVIGIFDIDNVTVTKNSREFLNTAEKNGEVINVTYELPKSFILTNKNKENKLYISQLSVSTLKKRIENWLDTKE